MIGKLSPLPNVVFIKYYLEPYVCFHLETLNSTVTRVKEVKGQLGCAWNSGLLQATAIVVAAYSGFQELQS